MTINTFLARFQDQPSLVAPELHTKFETCLEMASQVYEGLHEKIIESASADDDFWGNNEGNQWVRRYRPYVVKDGVLQIPVKGVLLHDFPYQLYDWATGYEYIWRCFERGMGDYNVKGIALVVDSPGGMVAGCFEMVDRMWALKGTKPVHGYASESAYSAAYATISVADKITVSRTGGVGSIGVVTMHVDISKALEAYGYKITFIYAGKHKVDGNAYEALPDDVKARIQARIDDLYGIFVSTVARNRGLDEQAVRKTEALTYSAPDSLSVKLADDIGAFDDALAEFTASLNPTQGDEQMADYSQAQYDEAVANARTEGHAAGKSEGQTAGASTERARISAILGADAAQGRSKLANHLAFKTNMSADESVAMLAEAAVEQPVAATKTEDKPTGAGAPAGMMAAAMDNTDNPQVGAGDESGSTASFTSDPKSILALAASIGLKGFEASK